MSVGGESVLEELEAMDQWMLFQHHNLNQLFQELVVDVRDGVDGSTDAIQRVQGEVQELEIQLKKIAGEEEISVKEEVLQTRTVPIQEVRKDMEGWKQPFQEEYDTLCSTVIEPLSPSMLRQTLRNIVEKVGSTTMANPSVLVSMGIVPASESWLVTGAIYGLAQSPHDWGMHRDGMFRQFRWICCGEELKLVETPERHLCHLWRIVSETSQEEKGYLCSYVDDLLVTGKPSVVDATIQNIESTWSCSEPEYINNTKTVRFCGYELRWDQSGNLLLIQPNYILDLL